MNASNTARRAAVPASFGPCRPSPVHNSLRRRFEAAIDLPRRAAVRADVQPRAREMGLQRPQPRHMSFRQRGEHDLVDLCRGPLRPLLLQRERQLKHPGRRATEQREAAGRALRTRRDDTHGSIDPACRARPSRTARPGRHAHDRRSHGRDGHARAWTGQGRPRPGPARTGTGRSRDGSPQLFVPGARSSERVTLSADHAHGKAGTRVANSTPPDNRDTTAHGSAGPNLKTHARAASAIASSASAMPLPAGIT